MISYFFHSLLYYTQLNNIHRSLIRYEKENICLVVRYFKTNYNFKTAE